MDLAVFVPEERGSRLIGGSRRAELGAEALGQIDVDCVFATRERRRPRRAELSRAPEREWRQGGPRRGYDARVVPVSARLPDPGRRRLGIRRGSQHVGRAQGDDPIRNEFPERDPVRLLDPIRITASDASYALSRPVACAGIWLTSTRCAAAATAASAEVQRGALTETAYGSWSWVIAIAES